MKLYLASKHTNKLFLRILTDTVLRDHEVVSRWLFEEPTGPPDQFVTLKDKEDIDSADVVVGFHPFGVGTSAEMGYALGAGKPTLFCIDPWYLEELTQRDIQPLWFSHLLKQNGILTQPTRLLSFLDAIDRKLRGEEDHGS